MSNFIYVEQGSNFRPGRPTPFQGSDHLPARIYTIQQDDNGVFLATKAAEFSVPEKIYGAEIMKRTNLFLEKYRNSKTSVGMMLLGTKGSGKSLQVEVICNKLIAMGLPVIYIDRTIDPEIIKYVLGGIGECAAVFEEFGKIYSKSVPSDETGPSTQDKMLNMFSDTALGRIAFFLTDNGSDNISFYLKNRPGRVLFLDKKTSLEPDVFESVFKDQPILPEIMEYLKDWGEYFIGTNEGDRTETDFGIDVLFTIRDAAIGKSCIKDFLFEMSCLNVPAFISNSISVKNCKLADGTNISFGVERSRGEEIKLTYYRDGDVKTAVFNLEDATCYSGFLSKKNKSYFYKLGDMTVFITKKRAAFADLCLSDMVLGDKLLNTLVQYKAFDFDISADEILSAAEAPLEKEGAEESSTNIPRMGTSYNYSQLLRVMEESGLSGFPGRIQVRIGNENKMPR